MAATFVVEDGTGKTDANSYLSENDADTYFDNYDRQGNVVLWDAIADKEAALREATQYLDNEYRERWVGTKGSEDQALAWPRRDVFVSDGFLIDSNVIPQELKDACAELALRTDTTTTRLSPDITDPGSIRRTKDEVGPLKTEIEYSGGGKGPITNIFRIIEDLLRSLVVPDGTLERS
ncbi:MAG: hypothetical protein FVQ84_08500 [Planctomycetes bacterium]|nr:hypothetical protein [Planctomycetota bacterium]